MLHVQVHSDYGNGRVSVLIDDVFACRWMQIKDKH